MKGFLKQYGELLLVLAVLVLGLVGGRHIYQQLQFMNEQLDGLSRANLRLEEQMSLTETNGLMRRHWAYYGEIDSEARTIRVNVSLIPLLFDRDTQVSVVCNGETMSAPWDNGAYRVQMDAPLDASCRITALTVARGDQVEQAEMNWELMDHRSFTPSFASGSYFPDGSITGEDGEISGKAMLHLTAEDMEKFDLNLGNCAGTLSQVVDGETQNEEAIQWEDLGDLYWAEPAFTVYQVKDCDTEYVVNMTDRQGITFHYTALRYHCTDPEQDFFQTMESDVSTEVFGPDGTLLYTLPGEGSMPRSALE